MTLIPQWDLLTLLVDEARKQPTFRLVLEANVESVIQENGRAVGVDATDETDEGYAGEYQGRLRARDDSAPRLLSVWATHSQRHFS